MRVLLQVVKGASLTADGLSRGNIDNGFVLLVGFAPNDNAAIIDKMARKIESLRVFPDNEGKTNLSIKDVSGNVMSVSQFTLYASLHHGNRPSFHESLGPKEASALFDIWNRRLEESFPSLVTGVFGSDMQVSLVNDGPFTLMLDSRDMFGG